MSLRTAAATQARQARALARRIREAKLLLEKHGFVVLPGPGVPEELR